MQDSDYSKLCEADQQVLDHLVEHGFDARGLGGEQRARADKLLALLALLEELPEVGSGDLLAARTLAALARARQQERFAQQIHALATPVSAAGWSFRDMVAAAAIFLISVSVMWPVLSSARGTARQIACQTNLAVAGRAMASYAAANHDAMPASKVRLGNPWWLTNQFADDGSPKSNSAHLFTLVREGFASLDRLACPENSFALRVREQTEDMRDWPHTRHVSFSYQNQYSARRPKLHASMNLAVLGDKNPFFETGRFRLELRSDANSNNHTQRGQNVLLASGRVVWTTQPLVDDEDNIYHAGDKGLDFYTGMEGPADVTDSFLVP